MCATLPRSASRTCRRMSIATNWYQDNTMHHGAFAAAVVAATRGCTISVCLPARNEALTIGTVLERLLPLVQRGIVDEVVVVDDSKDGTGDIARRLGATVYDQSSLMPQFGPVRGKGDAMWRALSVLTGDVVCFLDADTRDFSERLAIGLIGPLVHGDQLEFVKGFYRRPLQLPDGTRLPEGGGRVTELLARPLLNRFHPELAGFVQPLAGEIAARRDLLDQLPFALGYGVDIALLIDASERVGIDRLAQVDLGIRQNRHQPLADLGPMAAAVLAAVTTRLQRAGRLEPSSETFLRPDPEAGLREDSAAQAERPPMASLHGSVAII